MEGECQVKLATLYNKPGKNKSADRIDKDLAEALMKRACEKGGAPRLGEVAPKYVVDAALERVKTGLPELLYFFRMCIDCD